MSARRKAATQTLESLKARTVEVGDCWEWQGPYTYNGKNPIVRHKGKAVTARRLALQLSGEKMREKTQVLPTCDNHRCINPEHLRQYSSSDCMKIQGAKGLMSDQVRSAKIAAAKRAQMAKLTIEQVREIRQRTTTIVQAAEKYGVHPSKISLIRRHQIWREHSTPWAGLGARK